jgi:RimJ/RimL family protein N-acetyltransferase
VRRIFDEEGAVMELRIEPARLHYVQVCQLVPQWLNDRQHMRYSRHRHLTHTAQDEYDYLQHNAVWAVLSGPDVVGTVSAAIDAVNGIVDIGVLTDPKRHGEGIATTAFKLLIAEFVPTTRLITAGCAERHWAMRKVCEKNEMTLDAILPRRLIIEHSGVVGMCCYSIAGKQK